MNGNVGLGASLNLMKSSFSLILTLILILLLFNLLGHHSNRVNSLVGIFICETFYGRFDNIISFFIII